MVGRAAFNISGAGIHQLYFFKGPKYVKINWLPGHLNDALAAGPSEITTDWASLREAGFTQVDAILPLPGTDHRAYFFSGDKYARIGFVPGAYEDQIYGGVRSITENWKSLAKAGFDHVDAALLVPGTSNQAYFFSGKQYCRVSFKEGSEEEDELLDGPKDIITHWGAKFETIDAIFPEPKSKAGVYMFSGSKYAKINLVVGGYDELVTGPKDVAPFWPSLHTALFY